MKGRGKGGDVMKGVENLSVNLHTSHPIYMACLISSSHYHSLLIIIPVTEWIDYFFKYLATMPNELSFHVNIIRKKQ